jgi:hypothetical protein
MEELLMLLLQGLVEFVLQIIGSNLLDGVFWWGDLAELSPPRGCIPFLLAFAGGGLLGWLSLLVAPHTLMHTPALRIGNVLISPLLSGWIAWRLACWRRRRQQRVVPWFHACTAGLACLGLVLVRFTWAQR